MSIVALALSRRCLRAAARSFAIAAVLAAGPAMAAGPKARPSFDCAKARSGVERAICADPALARHDRDIAQVYRVKLAAFEPVAAAALKQDQHDFLAVRDGLFEEIEQGLATYAVPDNLAELMQERLKFLRRLDTAPRKGVTGDWAMLNGTLEVMPSGEDAIDISLVASEPLRARWVCEIGEETVRNGDTATVRGEHGAQLRFHRDGAVMVVDESFPTAGGNEGRSLYCGRNGSAAGRYLPVRK